MEQAEQPLELEPAEQPPAERPLEQPPMRGREAEKMLGEVPQVTTAGLPWQGQVLGDIRRQKRRDFIS